MLGLVGKKGKGEVHILASKKNLRRLIGVMKTGRQFSIIIWTSKQSI